MGVTCKTSVATRVKGLLAETQVWVPLCPDGWVHLQGLSGHTGEKPVNRDKSGSFCVQVMGVTCKASVATGMKGL